MHWSPGCQARSIKQEGLAKRGSCAWECSLRKKGNGGGEWELNPPAAVMRRNGFEDRGSHRAPVTSVNDCTICQCGRSRVYLINLYKKLDKCIRASIPMNTPLLIGSKVWIDLVSRCQNILY